MLNDCASQHWGRRHLATHGAGCLGTHHCLPRSPAPKLGAWPSQKPSARHGSPSNSVSEESSHSTTAQGKSQQHCGFSLLVSLETSSVPGTATCGLTGCPIKIKFLSLGISVCVLPGVRPQGLCARRALYQPSCVPT